MNRLFTIIFIFILQQLCYSQTVIDNDTKFDLNQKVIKKGQIYQIHSRIFLLNHHKIDTNSNELDSIITFLQSNDTVNFCIKVYTLEPKIASDSLSKRRANSLKLYFISKGIVSQRIDIECFTYSDDQIESLTEEIKYKILNFITEIKIK